MRRLIFLLSFVFLFNYALPVGAFSVSPLRYIFTVDPGASQSSSLTVQNNEQTLRSFQVSVQTLVITEDGRRLYQKNIDEAESWVKIDASKFNLSPGQKNEVKFTINVPPGSAPGSHPLVLMVTAEAVGSDTVGLTAKTALPIFLTVAGTVTESLLIQEWKSDGKFQLDRAVSMTLNLRNKGTVNVGAAGIVETQYFGKEVTKQNLNLGSSIFPNSNRRLSFETLLKKNSFPGPYKAKLFVQYGAAKSVAVAEYTFWYFPYYLIIVPMTFLSLWLLKRKIQK